MKDRKKPAIRFKGFTEDWEQRKLGEIAEIRRGLTYKPDDVKTSGIRVLRSSNINEEYFETYKDDIFVDEIAINIPYVKNGDIIITSANGSSRLVGKHAIIKNIPDNAMVHGGFMLVASTNEPEFLNSSMSSPWYVKFINIYVAGGNGAIGNLSKRDLDNQEILVPYAIEQQKIGIYFQHLDNLITLHQRKYDKLVNIKKSMLEKMFPRDGKIVSDIRFSGFTEDWEQRKVGEFLTESRIRGNTGLDAMKLTVKLWGKGVVEKNDFGGSEHTQYFTRRKGQFIYSKLDFLNSAFGVIPEKLDNYESTADLPAFDLDGMNPYFMYFVAIQESFYLKHGSIADGSRKAKRIHADTFLNMPVMVPTIDEQNLIVDFLQHLDNLITLHQRKLEKLKNIKKSCLEKMFI